MKTNLPAIPNVMELLRKGAQNGEELHPMWEKAAPALLASIAVGVETYKSTDHSNFTETDRLTNAIEEAARHFMILATTHGIK